MNSSLELQSIIGQLQLEPKPKSAKHAARERKLFKQSHSDALIGWNKWLALQKLPDKITLDRPDNYPNCAIGQEDLQEIAWQLRLPILVNPPREAHSSVYILKCLTDNHWYIGRARCVVSRFKEHLQGVDYGGAVFTHRHGVFCVWATYAVGNQNQADALENITWKVLQQVYPDFCISMGMPCNCVLEGVA